MDETRIQDRGEAGEAPKVRHHRVSHKAAIRRDFSVRSVSNARLLIPFNRKPTVTFSPMDIVGNGFDFWNTMPTRRRTITASTSLL